MKSSAVVCGVSALMIGLAARAAQATAIWTGLGGDDRWANPQNWSGGQLPTSSDVVVEDPAFLWWQSWPHTRQISVTIDSAAQAGTLQLSHYGAAPGFPFTQIRIVAGADFHTGIESIDHDDVSETASYLQTGGAHTVGDFYYNSGDFRMEGGTFTANKIVAQPDFGSFQLLGGYTQAARLELGTGPGYDFPTFKVGAGAEVRVTEQFVFSANWDAHPETRFERPIYMDGADFTVETEFGATLPWYDHEPFDDMHLIFGGDVSDVGLVEICSFDFGSEDQSGWIENAMIGAIEIGNDQPAHIRLVDEVSNWDLFAADWSDAQYVDTLRIGSGSVLDLNGLNLYCRVLENNGGTFVNGQPVVVPEPGAVGLLCVTLGCRRRRRRG